MTFTGIISAIIIGLVIGALGPVGRARPPTRPDLADHRDRSSPRSGSFIAGALGYANANGGIPWVLLVIQIIVAAIGVVIAANLYARRGGARR